MGREGISGPKKRPDRRGLKVKVRGGVYHLAGTIRVGRRSQRVRESTGIDRSAPGARDLAEARRIRREAEILEALVHGRKPPVPFAAVAGDYLEAHDPGPADLRNIGELLVAFGTMGVHEIDRPGIEHFYKRRFPGRAAATVRRHMASLRAVLGHGVKQGALEYVPQWTRPEVAKRKGKSISKRFLPGEAELLIDSAAPHVRPIMALEYCTGTRTGAAVHLLKENFVLAFGRGRVHFPETKNGNSYSRALHDYAVGVLLTWLETRDDDHPEMFLTDKGRPYVVRIGHGGHIEAAYNAARDRCVARLIEMDMDDRARVIAASTPHWFRHNFANRLRREKGWDSKMIAVAGMWEDEQVVGDHYLGDESDIIEEGVRSLEFGKSLTQVAKEEEQGVESA